MIDYGFYNMDCMEGMMQFPDKYFDLAIVDPPYGDGIQKIGGGGAPTQETIQPIWEPEQHIRTIQTVSRTGGTWATRYGKKIISWDVAPGAEYFKELFRISRNQIIWGGNYFELPPTRCFLIWRKLTISDSFSMAMCEYAWTSFSSNAKIFEYQPQGKEGERFHPTQKPVALYEWILNRYAKPGDTILDTHAGRASSLIACHRTGHKYVGFEIDEYYYQMAKKRLDAEEAQMNIFEYMKQQ